MKKKSYLFVANFKNYFQFYESISYCSINHAELAAIALKHTLILCPSFVALASIKHILTETKILLGAQDCSPFSSGPYTGEVSAQALVEVGSRYCIVGHSETRTIHHENDEIIAQKVERLFEQKCTPIVCIGEEKEGATQDTIIALVRTQLTKLTIPTKETLCIAYEPLWAIGKEKAPDTKCLGEIMKKISELIKQLFRSATVLLLYGGSVSPEAMPALLENIPWVDGFLIGNASTDFQKLQNIVRLTEK